MVCSCTERRDIAFSPALSSSAQPDLLLATAVRHHLRRNCRIFRETRLGCTHWHRGACLPARMMGKKSRAGTGDGRRARGCPVLSQSCSEEGEHYRMSNRRDGGNAQQTYTQSPEHLVGNQEENLLRSTSCHDPCFFYLSVFLHSKWREATTAHERFPTLTSSPCIGHARPHPPPHNSCECAKYHGSLVLAPKRLQCVPRQHSGTVASCIASAGRSQERQRERDLSSGSYPSRLLLCS